MASETVGSADYQLGTDLSGLKKGLNEADGLVKASGQTIEGEYKSAAYRAGEHIGNGIKIGLKVVGGAAAAAFGIATKGVIELENATADFRAETGATAEEAERAGAAINKMAGKNMQPVKEIGKTMSNVVTMLGLTGKAAEDTTQDFLTFARATKQDAGTAVAALDDILDGFNLEAADSRKIMDVLVASHQKYGGSIEANQAALSAMAPQLKALNLSWEDGVELLNLFASSGLDAAAGQRALNTAIANLPAGTSLDDFVKELSSIEDPAKRAARATEVFGARAGPMMASALKPGMESLDAFGITAEQAAGKTQAAADALDSTFSAKITLKIKEFTSALTGMGKEFGPVLTGLASMASLAGALGLEKFGPQVVAALKSAGTAGGEAFKDALDATGIGAAGTVIGNNIASRIEAVFAPGKTRIERAATAAGLKIGAAWGAAVAGASKIGELMAGVLMKMGVNPAVLAAATASGSMVGAAIVTGMIAGAVAGTFLVWRAISEQLDAQAADLTEKTRAFAQVATVDGLMKAREGIADQIRSLPGNGMIPDIFGAKDKLLAQADLLTAEIEARGMAVGKAYSYAATASFTAGMPDVIESVKRGFAPLETVAGESLAAAQHGATEGARRFGNLMGISVAEGILEKRQAPADAWDTFLEMLKNSMTPAQETARLLGRLTSDRLANGLKSGDPAVRAQAEGTKQIILDRLKELAAGTEPLTKAAAKFVEKGLKSNDKEIKAAALAIKNNTLAPVKLIPPAMNTYGQSAGQQFVNGIKSKMDAIAAAAKAVGMTIQKYLKTLSPSELGPLSTGGGPEGWGVKLAGLYATGIELGVPDVRRASERLAGAIKLPTGTMAPIGDFRSPEATYQLAARAGTQVDVERTAGGTSRAGGVHQVFHVGGITIQFTEAVDFGRDTPRSIGNLLAQEIRLSLSRTPAW